MQPEERVADTDLGRHVKALLIARSFEAIGSTKWMQLGYAIKAARARLEER